MYNSNQVVPIELSNVRVLSTTYEKLLCVISEEQNEVLSAYDIPIKQQENETYGVSYTIVVKCASDKMCELYKSIKRCDITKSCYDLVVVKADWVYGGKSGVKLDAYFIRKLEPVIRINDAPKRMCNGEEDEVDEVIVVKEPQAGTKKIVVNKYI